MFGHEKNKQPSNDQKRNQNVQLFAERNGCFHYLCLADLQTSPEIFSHDYFRLGRTCSTKVACDFPYYNLPCFAYFTQRVCINVLRAVSINVQSDCSVGYQHMHILVTII